MLAPDLDKYVLLPSEILMTKLATEQVYKEIRLNFQLLVKPYILISGEISQGQIQTIIIQFC